jgi:hypothetical protein
MKRDHQTVLHFTCDGSVELLSRIDRRIFSPGDTATASRHGGTDTPWIWRCTSSTPSKVTWEAIEPWSEIKVAAFVEAATMLVVVTDSADPDYYRALVQKLEQYMVH